MVISVLAVVSGIPSTGRVAVIALQTPLSEMMQTARKVISRIPFATENHCCNQRDLLQLPWTLLVVKEALAGAEGGA